MPDSRITYASSAHLAISLTNKEYAEHRILCVKNSISVLETVPYAILDSILKKENVLLMKILKWETPSVLNGIMECVLDVPAAHFTMLMGNAKL